MLGAVPMLKRTDPGSQIQSDFLPTLATRSLLPCVFENIRTVKGDEGVCSAPTRTNRLCSMRAIDTIKAVRMTTSVP
jgi:hypothetical protein